MSLSKRKVTQEEIFLDKAKIASVFSAQSENRWNVAQESASDRIAKLKKIVGWIEDNRQAIRDAIYKDFRKPAVDVDLAEIFTVLSEARHAIRNLKNWSRPHRVRPTRALLTTKSWIQYEPRGIALIIAPWNFPFVLNVSPLISAIAAGNCAIIKPSELAKHTSGLISRMVTELFKENEVAVFEGEKDVAIELLSLPFDHIFFTGSTTVGKKVMTAAAKNLTSLTLELGGKSPGIIDETANIADAAHKIAWSKFMNCGQTCIAPDYILVHKSIEKQLIDSLKIATQKFYGTSSEKSNDYARIINSQQFKHLKVLLDSTLKMGAVLEAGGKLDESENYMPPTILSNVSFESPVMEEEIFGPLLPVVSFDSIEDAINLVNSRPKPLSLYIFSKNRSAINKILNHTSSGGACINDTVIHFSQTNLPFGGVGASGMGKSHGFHGFKEFSHEKAVVKHHRFSPLKLMYPPYTKRVQKIVDLVLKYF